MQNHVKMPHMACIRVEVSQRRKKLFCQGGQESFTETLPGSQDTARIASSLTGQHEKPCLSLNSKPMRQNFRNYAPSNVYQVPSFFFQEAPEFEGCTASRPTAESVLQQLASAG